MGRLSKPSLVIVVLEDDRHQRLIYKYLKECGVNRYQIRIERSPSGEGSAESWVRKRLVKEVGEYRVRQPKAETRLIIIIDADTSRVADRLNQLDQALRESGKETVAVNERIARLVPKRNVETWVLCLNGQPVDEETDYKQTTNDWSELIPPAAKNLCEWTRSDSELPSHCVASLRSGVDELKRARI
jgi:hypothetical protein